MSPETEIAAVLLLIHAVRGQRVILDSDLARLYGVPTKYLNKQVRRNQRRFPADFAFVLSPQEASHMRFQIGPSSSKRKLSAPPVAYTEYGAVMAANVLNSDRAVAMSVAVVRAFIRLRKAVNFQGALSRKLAELERAVNGRLDRHDGDIDELFKTVEKLIEGGDEPPKKRIGFQVD
jgi:hypothetical protein